MVEVQECKAVVVWEAVHDLTNASADAEASAFSSRNIECWTH